MCIRDSYDTVNFRLGAGANLRWRVMFDTGRDGIETPEPGEMSDYLLQGRSVVVLRVRGPMLPGADDAAHFGTAAASPLEQPATVPATTPTDSPAHSPPAKSSPSTEAASVADRAGPASRTDPPSKS